MRLGGTILVAIMLLTPAAAAISTRNLHNDIWDQFDIPQAHQAAVPQDATVACNHPDNTGNDLCDNLWRDDNGDVVAASAPAYVCMADGVDLELSLQNPFPIQKVGDAVDDHDASAGDLKVSEHGVMLASGSIFVVPEISGADADQVTSVWFGFAETIPGVPGTGVSGASDELCVDDVVPGQAAGVHGGYYEFYRGDTDASDGWLIPVNTLLVPDNPYGAHLRFFGGEDAGGAGPGGSELLATAFVYATVDNNVEDEQWRPCTPTTASCDFQDVTPPWPTVTPGDVPLSSVQDKSRVVVEFGEHLNLDNTAVFVNGVKTSANDAFDGPVSADVDSFPLITVLTDDWGPRLVVELNNDLQPGDTIRVEAEDTHGNTATKSITLG